MIKYEHHKVALYFSTRFFYWWRRVRHCYPCVTTTWRISPHSRATSRPSALRSPARHWLKEILMMPFLHALIFIHRYTIPLCITDCDYSNSRIFFFSCILKIKIQFKLNNRTQESTWKHWKTWWIKITEKNDVHSFTDQFISKCNLLW